MDGKIKSHGTPLRHWKLRALPAILLLAVLLFATGASAVPGQSHGIVTLPGNGTCSVAGTFDGTYYITINSSSCSGNILGIYLPPPTGAGPATLVATKSVPVTLSAVDWDASRNMLWGVHGSTSGQAYLIDIGIPTVSAPATATLEFAYSIPGISLIDGLAWDFTDDTLWISPDVNCCVHHFTPTGGNLGFISSKNAAGVADGVVSGVAIGAANTLYIGRNGLGEIRRIRKSDGGFVSSLATANFRIEDLVCTPNLYKDPMGNPIEVILAKGAHTQEYEAFEVEKGTCPAAVVGPGPPAELVLEPEKDTNTVDDQHCVTATVTDANGNPTPNITVRFSVTGSVTTSGSEVTDANGQATFCYTGPALPGADVITAFADTDNDGVNDADEPEDVAEKTWVIPASTEGCKVTYGGRITAANGDKATFGGNAQAPDKGQEEYQDHGPAQPMNVHSIDVLSVVCSSDGTQASIFGTAIINGAGSFDYRIDLKDLGEPGTTDTYRIRLSNGYDSGEQTLDRGNVQIH